jgi:hypothetical protein
MISKKFSIIIALSFKYFRNKVNSVIIKINSVIIKINIINKNIIIIVIPIGLVQSIPENKNGI